MPIVSVQVPFILDIISLCLFSTIQSRYFYQTCHFESIISDGHYIMYSEVLPWGLLDLAIQKVQLHSNEQNKDACYIQRKRDNVCGCGCGCMEETEWRGILEKSVNLMQIKLEFYLLQCLSSYSRAVGLFNQSSKWLDDAHLHYRVQSALLRLSHHKFKC